MHLSERLDFCFAYTKLFGFIILDKDDPVAQLYKSIDNPTTLICKQVVEMNRV